MKKSIEKINKKNQWKTLGSKITYRNPWYHVRTDKVIRPDGQQSQYNMVIMKGKGVSIIALDERGNICLVGQNRYTTKKYAWELPTGSAEKQSGLDGAKRELLEETGFKARRWKKIGSFHPMVGISDEIAEVFVATGLFRTATDKKLEEGISAVRFASWATVRRMIKTGQITNGQSIAALGFYKL